MIKTNRTLILLLAIVFILFAAITGCTDASKEPDKSMDTPQTDTMKMDTATVRPPVKTTN